MPALKVNDTEMKSRELIGSIEKQMRIVGIKKPTLAKRINMPESTLYYRIRNPGTFSIKELQNIFAVLKMPKEEKERLGGKIM